MGAYAHTPSNEARALRHAATAALRFECIEGRGWPDQCHPRRVGGGLRGGSEAQERVVRGAALAQGGNTRSTSEVPIGSRLSVAPEARA